jgi:hypothetical protein
MSVFLTLYEGNSPAAAEPVVTSDREIIATVRRMLMERLGDTRTAPALQLVPSDRPKRTKGEVSTDGSE